MKMLQGLVPGCDKVTGKALILDEIINYVQCLQNQVEVNCKWCVVDGTPLVLQLLNLLGFVQFLSMKIASLSPVLYDFDVGFADCINQPQVICKPHTSLVFVWLSSVYRGDVNVLVASEISETDHEKHTTTIVLCRPDESSSSQSFWQWNHNLLSGLVSYSALSESRTQRR